MIMNTSNEYQVNNWTVNRGWGPSGGTKKEPLTTTSDFTKQILAVLVRSLVTVYFWAFVVHTFGNFKETYVWWYLQTGFSGLEAYSILQKPFRPKI